MRRFRFLILALVLPACACGQHYEASVDAFISVRAPVIALAHVRVIDGTGTPGKSHQTIIIQDGRIVAVGDSRTSRVPPEARMIDLTGRTVLPGYVMVHEHLFFTPDGNGETSMRVSFPRLYLAGGATTIRTAGSRGLAEDLKLKNAIDGGTAPGPTIELTSLYLDQSMWPSFFGTPEDRGRRLAAKMADAGATSYKAYEHLSRAELRGLIAGAHERGLQVTGHVCAVTFAEAAELGIDNLEHGIWTATDFVVEKQPDVCPPSDVALGAVLSAKQSAVRKLIDKLVGSGVAVTSTLPVFETFLSTREPATDKAIGLMSPKSRKRYLDHRAELAAAPVPVWGKLLRKEMDFEVAFVRAGGLLAAGSDPTGHGGIVAGFSNQREIELLVEAGFSPIEAIQIATLNGARVLGREADIGSIAKGKRADLIVVAGNPEELITDIKRVETVFKDGVGYDPAKLMESVREIVGTQ